MWFLFSSSGTSCWTTLSGMVGSAPVGLYGDVASSFSASCLITLENLSAPWSLQALQSQGWSGPAHLLLDPQMIRNDRPALTHPRIGAWFKYLPECSFVLVPVSHGVQSMESPARAPLTTSSRLWMPSGPLLDPTAICLIRNDESWTWGYQSSRVF